MQINIIREMLDYHGFPQPPHIKFDAFTRWGKNNRYYMLVLPENKDKITGIHVGDFVAGTSMNIYDKKPTKHVQNLINRQINQQNKKDNEQAIANMVAVWENSLPVLSPHDHPYLEAKQVFTIKDLRVLPKTPRYPKTLVIPIFGANGAMCGLQLIYDEKKFPRKFMSGSVLKGAFFVMGKPRADIPLYIGEGYATCASVYQSISFPVVCAFSAWNLRAVAKHFYKLGFIDIRIAADNDFHLTPNMGIEKAKACAPFASLVLYPPKHHSINGVNVDFNDVYLSCGADVCASLLK